MLHVYYRIIRSYSTYPNPDCDVKGQRPFEVDTFHATSIDLMLKMKTLRGHIPSVPLVIEPMCITIVMEKLETLCLKSKMT